MAVLPEAKVRQAKERQPREDNQEVGVGSRARDLANHPQKRDVLHEGEGVLTVLRRKSFVPLDVLPYDILGATDQHRSDKAHDRPADESQDEAGLALDEEEECQADDAIELDERPQNNEEGGRDFSPLLDSGKGADDDGSDGDIELLHLQRRK